MRYDYKVRLSPYMDCWTAVREAHCQWIESALKGIEFSVHDIGSRMIPNLPSKNIVDLLIKVDENECNVVNRLAAIGLEVVSVPEISNIPMLRLRDGLENPILHVHVDRTLERPDVRFHRRLMVDSDLVREYGEMKRLAEEQSGGDARIYSSIKSEYFAKKGIL